MKVAIDGPAGAGKSTVSKAIAKNLGFIYIDTGAMYRTVGYSALKKGIDIKNRHDLMSQLMDDISIDVKITPGGQLMFLDGEDVTGSIRTEAVSMAASDAAAIGEVREKLVRLQREFAEGKNVVMDGRDIGTHVLPDAECKIYLTASVLARGRRRYDELMARGEACSLEDICRDIELRDKNDSNRTISPLRRAEDALLLDTTDMTLEQSVAAAEKIVNEKLKEI